MTVIKGTKTAGLTSPEAIKRAKRRRLAMELRSRGVTLAEVATLVKQAGMAPPSYNAHRAGADILIGIHEISNEPAHHVKAMENHSLATLKRDLLARALKGDMAAASNFIRASERWAKFNGYDAVVRSEVEMTHHWDGVTQFVVQILSASVDAAGLSTEQRVMLMDGMQAQLEAIAEAGPRVIEAVPDEEAIA